MVIRMYHFNMPLILTLARLVFAPLLLPVLLVYLLPFDRLWVNYFLTLLFVVFSLTDFFDGYLARKYQQETALGKILDPIADKFLLYSTLIALLAVNKIFFYWPIILIGREFLVMGIRLIALEYRFSILVSYLGKIKTMVHMICLALLILNPYQKLGISGAPWWNGLESLFILLAILFSLASVWQYCQEFITYFTMRQIQKVE
jgi:CDP-diacylglycerol--glycerol-3-phosphate 3-phosphatidyltransferase